MTDTSEKCEWCGRSVAGDAAADRGPGTAILCFRCRTLGDEAEVR